MTEEAQPWFAPTGENFDFGSFILLKTACFYSKNPMSQVLYLREFLETYDDKVIILKVIFVPIFYYSLTQPFETKETTILSLLHTTPTPFLLLNICCISIGWQSSLYIIKNIIFMTLGTILFLGFTQAEKKIILKNSANSQNRIKNKRKWNMLKQYSAAGEFLKFPITKLVTVL